MIYNKTKFEKIFKINDVEKIKRVLTPKSFLLIIDFNNDSRINYFKIKMKST